MKKKILVITQAHPKPPKQSATNTNKAKLSDQDLYYIKLLLPVHLPTTQISKLVLNFSP